MLKGNQQKEASGIHSNNPTPSELFQHHNFDINIDLAISTSMYI
jgi:hypothetical protein